MNKKVKREEFIMSIPNYIQKSKTNIRNVVERNAFTHGDNMYNQVYTESNNSQLSTMAEPSIKYEYVNHYVSVSSRDRLLDQYQNVNRYVVNLPEELRNIYSIELVQAIIPDVNNVLQEPYLLLKIDEIEDVMLSVDRNMSDAFAILQLCSPTVPGGFIQIDKRVHEHTVKYFKTPKATLAKMSISITDCNGVLFNFGANETVGHPVNKALQNTFVFKVVCLEKQRETLNTRGVF
jgi:hypothetical protein